MTINEIITGFELQVSDTTELSSSEELIVANRVYTKICNNRPWEWLKTSSAGSVLQDANGYYISTPTDFAFFIENNSYTQNNIAVNNNTSPKVVFIGTNYTPYQVINYSDRRQYRNQSGYVYYDAASNAIRFTGTPEALIYEFDYIKVPPALILGASPIFPARFHDVIIYGMAVDDQIIQLSPKASSYAAENQAKYQSCLDDMIYWNANLIQM
jgi:hypothetical protein